MDELKHYGVKGMHWGVRRYQNYNGTRIGATRRNQSGGGFDSVSKKNSKFRRVISKGVNDKPLGLKVKELNAKRYKKAYDAASKDAKNLREHGYIEEAKAVQKVADKNKEKANEGLSNRQQKQIERKVFKDNKGKIPRDNREEFHEKAADYANDKVKGKDYSNSHYHQPMNDWFNYRNEYYRNHTDEYCKAVLKDYDLKKIDLSNPIAKKQFDRAISETYEVQNFLKRYD